MGAEFLMLDFEEGSDGSETGGYAAPSSPEFRILFMVYKIQELYLVEISLG